MKNRFKKAVVLVAVAIMGVLGLSACETDSTVVNKNLDTAAENFEIMRRVVAINTQDGSYLISVEGRCDISPKKGRTLITCKVADGDGADAYKRHQVYTNNNRVVVFVEQLEAIQASAYHYRVTFKPQQILPDIDFRGSTGDNPLTDKNDGQ